MRISKKISLETQFKIELALFRTFYQGCRLLPPSGVIGLGTMIGKLAWHLKVRRHTVMENLRLALGTSISDRRRLEIANAAYHHFGAEMLRLLILDRAAQRPLEDWIDIEGYEALRNRKKPGGILVTGHLGCWEIASFVLPRLGENVTVYTGAHANEKADRLLNEIRSKAGIQTSGAADDRQTLMEKAKTRLVALAGDIRPHKAPVVIDFFGQKTEAAQGPALMALLNEIDLFYFSCIKQGKRFKIRFEKVVHQPAATRRENVVLLTQAFFDVLQKDVEAHPEQYYWFHRRWKNRQDVNYGEKEALF
jgi:Kdo2-lipid IVA lauroyltransferase/acyltransferase